MTTFAYVHTLDIDVHLDTDPRVVNEIVDNALEEAFERINEVLIEDDRVEFFGAGGRTRHYKATD